MVTTKPKPISAVLDRPKWLPKEQWPFVLRRYDHRQPGQEPLAIHYTDEGDGPVLVFVHAGMWSFIWRDVITALRNDFRCISLDFPGAGLSTGTRQDVDLSTFSPIVNGLLAHLQVNKATYVIHDLGGVVGITAAGDNPAVVQGIVATNSFAWRPEGRALKAMLAIMGSRTTTGLLGTFRVIPRASRTNVGVGRHYDKPARTDFFGPYRSRARSRNLHRAMRSARRSPELFDGAEGALKSKLSHVPVLTVFGEENDPFCFADRWESLFPRAQRWTVPNGNHFPMCDDPAGYAKRIRTWHRQEVKS